MERLEDWKSILCNIGAGKDHNTLEFPTRFEATACIQRITTKHIDFIALRERPVIHVGAIGHNDQMTNDKTKVIFSAYQIQSGCGCDSRKWPRY